MSWKIPVEESMYVSISISDPYASIKNDTLLIEIKKEYEKKCYNGRYIQEVVSISGRTALKVNGTNNTGYAMFDAKIDIKSIMITKGDYLVGCNVMKLENNMVFLRYEGIVGLVINLIVPSDVKYENFKINDKLAIQISEVLFRPNLDNILAFGILIENKKNNECYEIFESAPSVRYSELTDAKLLDSQHMPLYKHIFKTDDTNISIIMDRDTKYLSLTDDFLKVSTKPSTFMIPANAYKIKPEFIKILYNRICLMNDLSEHPPEYFNKVTFHNFN